MKTPSRIQLPLLHAYRKQLGLSLIELMVSLTIGLIIILALVTAFLNFSRTNREMAKNNIMIENGRLAIHVLQNDMVHAGFWGGYVPQFDNLAWTSAPADVPGSAPDACLAYNAANWTPAYLTSLVGIPLQVYDAAPATCNLVITNKKASSDVIVVRHAETCIPGVGNCESDVAGKLYFQASRCSADPSPYVIDTDTSKFVLRNMDCPAPPAVSVTPKRKFISNIYYIRDYANSPGDGMPTLVRSQFDLSGVTLAHQAAVPLIEGIEGMRVEIGVDNLGKTGAATDYTAAVNWLDAANKTTPTNRGDGTPDGDFVSCTTASPCTAPQLVNAVAAKIYLLARNLEPTPEYTDSKTYHLGTTTLGPFNDHYKRHLFSTTVRLVNVSARRETP